jgi:hypothetical protein
MRKIGLITENIPAFALADLVAIYGIIQEKSKVRMQVEMIT